VSHKSVSSIANCTLVSSRTLVPTTSALNYHQNKKNVLIATANRRQLMVPRHRRSTFGVRAVYVAGPMEWNSLPADSLQGHDRTASDRL